MIIARPPTVVRSVMGPATHRGIVTTGTPMVVSHLTVGTIRRITSDAVMDTLDIDTMDAAVGSACTLAAVTSRSATIGDPNRLLTIA